jgi:hypothetical protein
MLAAGLAVGARKGGLAIRIRLGIRSRTPKRLRHVEAKAHLLWKFPAHAQPSTAQSFLILIGVTYYTFVSVLFGYLHQADSLGNVSNIAQISQRLVVVLRCGRCMASSTKQPKVSVASGMNACVLRPTPAIPARLFSASCTVEASPSHAAGALACPSPGTQMSVVRTPSGITSSASPWRLPPSPPNCAHLVRSQKDVRVLAFWDKALADLCASPSPFACPSPRSCHSTGLVGGTVPVPIAA